MVLLTRLFDTSLYRKDKVLISLLVLVNTFVKLDITVLLLLLLELTMIFTGCVQKLAFLTVISLVV